MNNERWGGERGYLSFHKVAEGTNSRTLGTSRHIQRGSALFRPIPLDHLNLQFTGFFGTFLPAWGRDAIGGTCVENTLRPILDDRRRKSGISLRCTVLGALAACRGTQFKGWGCDRRQPGCVAGLFRGFRGRGVIFGVGWGGVSVLDFIYSLRGIRIMSVLWGLRLASS
jgi:hypothetical protein